MNKLPEGTHRNTTPLILLHCDQCMLTHRNAVRGLVYCDSKTTAPSVGLLNGETTAIYARMKGMQNPQKVVACTDFDADVAMLQLGDRAYWILLEMKIYTIQELCKKPPQDLLAHPNLGNKSLEKIQQALAKIGFALKTGEPRPMIYQSQPGER